MKKILLVCLLIAALPKFVLAQHSDESSGQKKLAMLQDSLTSLGRHMVNDTEEMLRKNANYLFIKTMVSALKVQNSFLYPFDSLKTISILNSPDNRFRIFSWSVMNDDGSYRFYGAIQINTGGGLKLFPLNDYSPLLKNPEDSVVDNSKWYGAEYYKIIRVNGDKQYYTLLGWKGNNDKSTKKVIEVLSFNKSDKPVFGAAVFDNDCNKKRVIFEYNRKASMILNYIPEKDMIVFDHLSAPDDKQKNVPEAYGPDLSYDGYELFNGHWRLKEDLDMRNMPDPKTDQYIDPKKQAKKDMGAAAAGN